MICPGLTAVKLVDLGFSISPPLVRGGGKGQTIEKWKPYQTCRASARQVSVWFKRFPNHNYAVITGAVSDLVVLDADDQEGVRLIQKRCPPTPMTQITGSGRGMHFLYRHPGTPVKNCRGIRFSGQDYLIDVRGDGGLFVGPGSIHEKTGGVYEQTREWTPELLLETPVFRPGWLSLGFNKKPAGENLPAWKKIVPKSQWKYG